MPLLLFVFLQLGFQEVGRAAGTPSVYVLAGHTVETQFENGDDVLHADTCRRTSPKQNLPKLVWSVLSLSVVLGNLP